MPVVVVVVVVILPAVAFVLDDAVREPVPVLRRDFLRGGGSAHGVRDVSLQESMGHLRQCPASGTVPAFGRTAA